MVCLVLRHLHEMHCLQVWEHLELLVQEGRNLWAWLRRDVVNALQELLLIPEARNHAKLGYML